MIAAIQLFLIVLSGLTIALADTIIKKISSGRTFVDAFFNPWMLLVYILYFVQILFAIWVFMYQKELGIYSNIFIVFYSILSIGFGILIFREHLSLLQYAGIGLALVGILMMNSH
ncbi:MAG: hypothetical protein JWL82_33 [Parcubacteria group bacterium]|nr:hypothetical protein [Parcubacteria group bacterium]